MGRGGPWVDLEVFGGGLSAFERGFPESLDLLLRWLREPRVGADGEYAVGGLLAQLTEPSLWDRLRRRRPSWHVLHSVPSATATETSAATSTTS